MAKFGSVPESASSHPAWHPTLRLGDEREKEGGGRSTGDGAGKTDDHLVQSCSHSDPPSHMDGSTWTQQGLVCHTAHDQAMCPVAAPDDGRLHGDRNGSR